jgi:hypothetical protein
VKLSTSKPGSRAQQSDTVFSPAVGSVPHAKMPLASKRACKDAETGLTVRQIAALAPPAFACTLRRARRTLR